MNLRNESLSDCQAIPSNRHEVRIFMSVVLIVMDCHSVDAEERHRCEAFGRCRIIIMECIVILQCETSVRIVSGKLPELLRAESKLGSTCRQIQTPLAHLH